MLGLRAVRLALFALFAVLVSAAAAQGVHYNNPAGDQVNSGVAAFKAAHYDEAIAHFRRALELNPRQPFAKLYLATATAQKVAPGVETPENLKAAQESVELFQQMLAEDPHDTNSMKVIASIEFSVNKPDEAREWQKKILAEEPHDAEAAYTIGVIDWQQAHKNAMAALQAAGLTDDGEGNTKAPPKTRAAIRRKNAALVDEALQYLQTAIDNRPNYDDAMVYMNLTYHRKADLETDDAARSDDLNKAKVWAQKAVETRKSNEEKSIPTNPQPQ